MNDTTGPNRDYPIELVRLASAVTQFQCPIPGSRQLYKTSSAAHPETVACMKQADTVRMSLIESLSKSTISYQITALAAKEYITCLRQIVLATQLIQLDEHLQFEWKSGIESTKEAANVSSEVLMFELAMTVACQSLATECAGCDCSMAGDFASAGKQFKIAAGIWLYLYEEVLPNWNLENEALLNDIPPEATTGVAVAMKDLNIAYAQQMAVSAALTNSSKPSYSLVAKLTLGTAEKIAEVVKLFKQKAASQLLRMDKSLLLLLNFQLEYQRILSNYFLARSLWDNHEYGVATAMMLEATIALQKKSSWWDSESSIDSSLSFLSKDMAAVRTHMTALLQSWQLDLETVYFVGVVQQIPSTKRLQTGMIMINKPEPYIVEDIVVLPLSIPQSGRALPQDHCEIQSRRSSLIQSKQNKTMKRRMRMRSFKVFGQEDDRTLIHGLLHITIIGATNLPNLDGLRGLENLETVDRFVPKFITNNKSDPYVVISADDNKILAKTSLKIDDLNPIWNETFYTPVAHYIKGITLSVEDKNIMGTSELIGKTFVPVDDLVKFDETTRMQMRVGLHKVAALSNGKEGSKSRGELEFFLELIPKDLLSDGLCDACDVAVPGVYFKSHVGNAVQLYVNADDGVGMAPEVRYGGANDDEKVWTPPRLWKDIYDAICEAKVFIYITGWAVDTTQSLLRGDEQKNALKNGQYSPFIGELLKQKANEGVKVNMLCWSDALGQMGTHDEQSKAFFKNSKVTFRLASMLGGDENILTEKLTKVILFTHHQKTIMLDAACQDDPERREPLAFVGGVDLTDGRWDNRKHPLFSTLDSDHKGDFYNGCIPTASADVGPRQPWHDIHSSVRGPVVLDVIANFRERWYKQASDAVGELLDLQRLGLADPPMRSEEAWCSQVLRSIDERTAVFDKAHISSYKNFHSQEYESLGLEVSALSIHKKGKHKLTGLYKKAKDNVKDALKKISIHDEQTQTFNTLKADDFTFANDLWLKKGRYVDISMHKGWVHHIRRARHTLYIESQYFLGSSHLWASRSETKCGNLIPTEITLKICEKIHHGERFAAYILVPMWPEGVPEAGPVQAILHWQKLTMESMYKRIAETLKKEGRHTESPKDYLNFYALAKREIRAENKSVSPQSPLLKQLSTKALAQNTGRHQIYVHSKMLIVDDAVTIIGSANINQRSMDGARDSEIAVASFQPAYLPTETSVPHGEVHGFRLHCWATITNKMENVFKDPSSLQCVRRLNEIAEQNWNDFISPQDIEMDSHLIPYPIEIDENGYVLASSTILQGFFPDTKASVLGAPSLQIPEILTT
mmetsp:Transcript_9831/g.14229  ORF Transcript_9831/g.14229 Transcript_9831/m.14229 type:complete len:1309 (+) Transcript_9831:172-4098(+)